MVQSDVNQVESGANWLQGAVGRINEGSNYNMLPHHFGFDFKNTRHFRMGLKWYSWIGLVKTFSGTYSKEYYNCPFIFSRHFKFRSASYRIHSNLPLLP